MKKATSILTHPDFEHSQSYFSVKHKHSSAWYYKFETEKPVADDSITGYLVKRVIADIANNFIIGEQFYYHCCGQHADENF